MAKKILLLLVLLAAGSAGVAATEVNQPTVTIMLFETDIRDALNEISLQTGINLVPDQTVSGTVTADIVEVPLEEALRLILIGGGYTFRKIDDFYLIGLADPRSSTFGSLVDTEIITLHHTSVEQVLALLPSFLQQYVKGDRQTNLLSVTAPPSEIERVRAFINQVDKPSKQVEIQVVITEISSQTIQELGGNLLEFEAQQGQQFNPNWTGSLTWSAGTMTIDTDIFGSLLTQLRLLESEQKAKIHADPKLLLADGQSADLFSGDRQILLIRPDDDYSVTSRIERIEVGLALKIQADLVGQDEVILKLAPEISYFVNEARPDLIVKRNSLTTTVRLKSGQTATLAGLTLQDTSAYTKQTPIIGSIPLIKWLFRTDVDRQSDKELLIFVTPVIQEE